MGASATCWALLAALAGAGENLAPRAQVTASSEYSANYAAGKAVDGRIEPAMSRRDAGSAWATRGAHQAEFTLQWPAPVTVAQIVYYGRTAFEWAENFKDYQVCLDG